MHLHFFQQSRQILKYLIKTSMENSREKSSTRAVCGECGKIPLLSDIEFDVETYVRNERKFLKVKWQDDYRCARAIMIGKAKADKDNDYRKIKNYSLWNVSAALYLHSISKVIPGDCGKQEVQMFQQALQDYQIVFLEKTCSHQAFKIMFVGPDAEKIFIYKHNGRFDAMLPWACL